MTIRVRRREPGRPKLVKAVADRIASALRVTENRVRVYASQGMPHWEGVEACQAWLRSRRAKTGSVLLQAQPAIESGSEATVTPVVEEKPDAQPSDAQL